jgi:hypothetical protein
MRLSALLPIAALAALAAGAAAGQPAASNGMSDQPTAATEAGAPAAAIVGGGGVTSSPTPADQAYLLKAGEPKLVSNGPVPDTTANRQLYGGPTSNAGRHTAPQGN